MSVVRGDDYFGVDLSAVIFVSLANDQKSFTVLFRNGKEKPVNLVLGKALLAMLPVQEPTDLQERFEKLLKAAKEVDREWGPGYASSKKRFAAGERVPVMLNTACLHLTDVIEEVYGETD